MFFFGCQVVQDADELGTKSDHCYVNNDVLQWVNDKVLSGEEFNCPIDLPPGYYDLSTVIDFFYKNRSSYHNLSCVIEGPEHFVVKVPEVNMKARDLFKEIGNKYGVLFVPGQGRLNVKVVENMGVGGS